MEQNGCFVLLLAFRFFITCALSKPTTPSFCMLQIISAHSLQLLTEALLKNLSIKGTFAQFFAKQPTVIVQNVGMSQWVKLASSQQSGASPRVDIQLPSAAIFRLQREYLGIDQVYFAKRWPLTQRIAVLLEQLKEHDQMIEATKQWLDPKSESLSDRRRWNFAHLIYDTFDEYELYRYDQLNKWRAAPNDWQKYLMQHLYADSEPGFRFKSMLASLAKIDEKPKILAPSYHFFALPTMVPYQLEWVKKISQHRPTYLYLLNDELSSFESISTKKQDNLWHFGAYISEQKQELVQLIQQSLASLKPSYIHLANDSPAGGNVVKAKNELDLLKQKLSSRELLSLPKVAALTDSTEHIHIASTHNRLREVEVLADWLNQKILSANATQSNGNEEAITASDMLIIAPNIADYRPHLASVFNTEDSPFPVQFDTQIPRNSGKNNLNEALDFGLNLLVGRCKSTEIKEWLSFKAIKDFLEIQDAELNRVGELLELSGIRWGLDKEHRKSFNLPNSNTNSWEFGLQRLILGSTSGELTDLYHGIDALDKLQTQDDLALIGKVHFITSHLKKHTVELNSTKKTMQEWFAWMQQFFEQVVDTIELTKTINSIQNQLGVYNEDEVQKPSIDTDEAISFGIFKSIISKELTAKKSSGYRQSGRMLCSDMVPMRNIPFKVIALLGLNDGEFPRTEQRAVFSYLNKIEEYRAGDRSRKLDDRALLKDYIWAAQQYLFISYQGKDAFTNEKKPPSPLIAQLIMEVEKIREIDDDSRAKVVTEYPMQAHSLQYKAYELNSPSKNVLNQVQKQENTFYTTAHKRLGTRITTDFWESLFEVEASAITSPVELSVEQFAKRLSNPIPEFVKGRLGIYLRENEFFDESDEPFNLNALDNHQLLDALLKGNLERDALTPQNLLAKGYCSDYYHALQVQQSMQNSLSSYDEAWEQWLDNKEIDITKQTQIEKTVVLNDQFFVALKLVLIDGWLVERSASSDKYKHRLPHIIMNVLLSEWLRNTYKGLILFMNGKDGAETLELHSYKKEDRSQKVEQLTAWLALSYKSALPFHTLIAESCLKKDKNTNEVTAIFDLDKMVGSLQEAMFKDEISTIIINPNLLVKWAKDDSANSFKQQVNFYAALESVNEKV